MGFSDQIELGRISMTGASVSGISIGSTSNPKTVDATHLFQITDQGIPGSLVGALTSVHTFNESQDDLSYGFAVSGTLVSTTGFSMTIDYSMSTAGAHSNLISSSSSTTVVWQEDSSSYSYSVTAVRTREQTSLNTWEVVDTRTCTDFGGAGQKTARGVTSYIRISDGVYQIDFDLQRDSPMQLPPLAMAGTQTIGNVETILVSHVQTTYSNGDFYGSVSRFDRALDGSLNRTLESGELGSYSGSADPANSSSSGVVRVYDILLPLIENGVSMPMTGNVQTMDSISGGKLFSSGSRKLTLGTVCVIDDTMFVDPPLGNPGLGTISFQEFDAFGIQRDGGFLDSLATCSKRGAALGGAIGGLAGGAIGAGAGAVAVPGIGSVPGWVVGGTAGTAIGAAGGGLIGGMMCTFSWIGS